MIYSFFSFVLSIQPTLYLQSYNLRLLTQTSHDISTYYAKHHSSSFFPHSL